MPQRSSWFQRIILPGLAFKAVVIGGGYATGRELVAFFMPSGPRGGLYGILLAMAVWSVVCVVTYLFALETGSRDYRTFFRNLLGPAWPAFEAAYFLAMMVILAVFSAAAGAIGQAVVGWPPFAGSLLLVAAITVVATYGNEAVEQLFKYVSIFLYATYGIFLILSLSHFGANVFRGLSVDVSTTGWAMGGLTYAGYNITGAVIILPVVRHLRNPNDALIAGLLSGPLAMAPALLFFVCMTAYYPQIINIALPSDFLLQQLGFPVFRMMFEAMIFAALLESGVGQVHAINERVATAYHARREGTLSRRARLCITIAVLVGSIFVADRVGLIGLIANGYRLLSYLFLGIYVLPLMTIGLWRLLRGRSLSMRPASRAGR